MSETTDRGAGCAIGLDKPGSQRSRIWLEAVKRTRVFYEGPVWCPSLPSTHWVARRNGRIFMTGNTYPTAVHTDKGDLDAGFSTLAVFRKGDFTGGWLCFPEYKVGVDLQDGDVLLMDAHEWHGNTQFDPEPKRKPNGQLDGDPGYERISVVCYYRTKMTSCGSIVDEVERRKEYAENRQAALVGE